MVAQSIGNDWKQLAELLCLPTDGTSDEQESYQNMKKCFDNVQERISWKTLKQWLQSMNKNDLVQRLLDETNTYSNV